MTDNNTCDRCGKTAEGIGWIARGYRKMTLRKGLPDPGNLCGTCAGSDTGKRIATEMIESEATAFKNGKSETP